MAAVALLGAGVAGAAGPRQTGSFAFTSTVPGTPTGNVLHVEFQNPDDPQLKPYAAARMVIHIPPGTITDTTVPPQCHATDAEIYALGPAACPGDSWIGSGDAYADQGNGTESHSILTHFNNQDEVVGIGVVEDMQLIKTIDRTKLENGTSTSNFPLFPGAPPPEPYTPVKRLDITFPPYVRDGRAYTTTPPACPKSGHWTFLVDFTYRDGVTETIESHSPCVKKAK
ncbi:MAG TPA: hypothetical protein VF712_09915 [Thermoleophilaceae bacterium]